MPNRGRVNGSGECHAAFPLAREARPGSKKMARMMTPQLEKMAKLGHFTALFHESV